MAKISKLNRDPRVNLGATPWGNLTVLRYVLETKANGSVVGGDVQTPVAAGDTVVLGVLPAGFRLIDSQVVVSAVLAGAAKLGFAYTDGVDVAKTPQDAEYFAAAAPLAAAGRVRSTSTKATICPQKDAYLVLTASAPIAVAGKVEVLVYAVAEGVAEVL